jgi:putative hydrolase of the HAD superfamily
MKKPLPPHKHIIFDLGGVLLNLSYTATADAFSRLCGYDAAELYNKQKQLPLFSDFETGAIDEATFRQGLRELFKKDLPDSELDAAWNAMLLDLPKERLELVQRLGQQKRVFLLSNTNAIHKKAFEQALQKAHGLPALDELFERAYYSHLMDARKPNPEIYLRVCQENGLTPAETLFIDDSPQHVAGAKEAGLQAYHLIDGVEITELDWGV